PGELVEQLVERLALALAKLCVAVERRESAIVALCEDDARAWDPVRALAVNEMSDDHVRAPRVRTLGGIGPRGRQAREHRVKRRRRPLEYGDGGGKFIVHGANL